MDKINFIFRQLLDYRRNTAIDFADADSQAKTYSGQIYWEYLNRLKEAINDYLSSFDFTCQIVIKESVVSIEIFSPSVGDVPYMTFSFGATSEINKSTCSNFTLLGFYSYNRTKLDRPSISKKKRKWFRCPEKHQNHFLFIIIISTQPTTTHTSNTDAVS